METTKKITITKKEYNIIRETNPYLALATAILKQACKDYREAYLIYIKHRDPMAGQTMSYIDRWMHNKIELKSGEKMVQCSLITDINPDLLLKLCKTKEIVEMNIMEEK